MTQQHTKTPWSCGSTMEIISCRYDECPIVAKVMPAPTRKEREANAAFIVRACNAHGDLVALVSEYMQFHKSGAQIEYAVGNNAKGNVHAELAKRGEIILAKARGDHAK